MAEPRFGPVARHLVGDNAPSVRPGDDPAILGTARLEGPHAVEARSFQTFRIVYTVGKLGLDDTGGIRVGFRRMSDGAKPQSTNPAAPSYVSAESTGEGRISLTCGMHGERPWNVTVTASQSGGYLKPGEQVILTFGDTRHGSPGMVMQTFAEAGMEFRVAADVQATGNFSPLSEQLAVAVVAGPVHHWRAVLPTLRRPGERFHLGIKAEDVWGNPTDKARGRVRLVPSLPVEGLPDVFDYTPDDRTMTFEGLSVAQPGTLRIAVEVDGVTVAEAGPLVIEQRDTASYWGDLHGQTGETIGINSAPSYFDFARNKSFLDVTSHQGNDFQINTAFWAHLNELTRDFDEPGRFVAIPGYEWSGNTAVGGDHNVFFRHEGRAIRRCSHALIEDRSDLASDANTLSELYRALGEEDCVLYAHVGGRYANIGYDHDPKLETAVEVHSAWGTFEWIATDSFALGRRVGIVANSDGHKGRPGASYPGAATFGSFGGLTCFLADRLDRDAIFEAMRRRHHYATTGCRMAIDLDVRLADGATLFERDPAVFPDAVSHAVNRAGMGDIVRTEMGTATIAGTLAAHAGIERIEVRNGAEAIAVLHPDVDAGLEPGRRVRILWSGAEYRGRGRNTSWRGRIQLEGNAFEHISPVNLWNPERLFEQRGSNTFVFDTITTGNFMGLDAVLADAAAGTLRIATNHGDLNCEIASIGRDAMVMEAGGLARQIRVFRLPDEPLPREFSFEVPVAIERGRDNPIWIAVTSEDGYQAWSSPTYIIP